MIQYDYIGLFPLAVYVAYRITRFVFRFIEAIKIWTDEKISSNQLKQK